MAELESLRKKVWDLFIEPTPPQLAAYQEKVASKTTLESVSKDQEGGLMIERFSLFNENHLEAATKVYEDFFETGNQHDDPADAIEAVLKKFTEYRPSKNPNLLYYALSVFITHHRFGKFLKIPNIILREPELVAPARRSGENTLEGFNDNLGGASGAEAALDWYREDPQQNEHHEHWHNVYPGRMDKDRQGEIFLYMHQQMLARYDAERLAVNLPLVTPFLFNTNHARIDEGYNPGDFVTDKTGFVKRDVNASAAITFSFTNQDGSVGTYTPQDHEQQRTLFESALNSARLNPTTGQDNDQIEKMDLLGRSIEPSGAPARRIPGSANYHGMGHVLIGKCHNGPGVVNEDATDGVMSVPATAIRDAIFYRWHRHIDDFGFRLQEKFPPRSYESVSFSFDHKSADNTGTPFSIDIILCHNKDIPGMTNSDFDGAAFGQIAFGNNNWDKDYSKGSHQVVGTNGQPVSFKTTDTLITRMVDGEIQIPGGSPVPYRYLNHEPFGYFLRIRNQGIATTATCRVFLVPKDQKENRRLWIELDKALVDLKRNSSSVFFQFDRKSSVVRKPAEDPARINPNYDPSILGRSLSTIEDVFQWENDLKAYYRRLVKVPDLANEERVMNERRQALLNAPPQSPNINQLVNNYVRAVSEYRIAVVQKVAYCDCGWPYNLLIPRGTSEGAEYLLMVMLTDTAYDADEIGCCGSMSYCGARDKYPDKRPMGYPFDRKFNNGIVNTLNSLPNVAFRTIKIQCEKL